MSASRYSDFVFVNCPLDSRYRPLLRAITFTILSCGLQPRCSIERIGAHVRIDYIVELIRSCKYGVHDLSRVGLSGGLPRFNMPLELGIFLGAQRIGAHEQAQKSALVVERDPYRYQRYISDLAGIDVVPHNNDVAQAAKAVRDWLVSASGRADIAPGTRIAREYEQFQSDFTSAQRRLGQSLNDVTYVDLVREMTVWINEKRVGSN